MSDIWKTAREIGLAKEVAKELLDRFKTLYIPVASFDSTTLSARLDPQTLAFREGQRTVVTYLLTEMGVNPLTLGDK